MSRFFVEPTKISDQEIRITGDDAHHIVRVRRMKPGELISVCDSKSTDYLCEITEAGEQEVVTRILSARPSDTEPPLDVVLFQGLPKGDKMEYIIQKCVELGITEIVPVATEFAVVKLEDKKAEERKRLRWNRISAEAAKQCGRGILPEVTEVTPLQQAIRRAKDFDLVFVPYEIHEESEERGFRALLEVYKTARTAERPRVGFFIGPEGGFSRSEIEEFRRQGIPTITLGKRILRTETAALAVLSVLMYEIGDMK